MRVRLFFIVLFLSQLNLYSATLYNACDAGRFGDNIVNYIKTKYLSLKYNIPLELKSFLYSDQLRLSVLEPIFQGKRSPCEVYDESQLKNINPNKQYMISYHVRINNWDDVRCISEWEDLKSNPQLMTELKKMISPIMIISSEVPKGSISIAVHIRKPSGQDNPLKSAQLYDPAHFVQEFSTQQMSQRLANDLGFPLKFPPNYFYIKQLQFLIDSLGNMPLYIYIFTDHENPHDLVDTIKKSLALRPNINIDYNRQSSHKNHVIEDLFFMAKFDYLIRSNSNFAQIAELIGNHKTIISPKSAKWYLNKDKEYCLFIDEINITHKQIANTTTG